MLDPIFSAFDGVLYVPGDPLGFIAELTADLLNGFFGLVDSILCSIAC